jgi:NAD(P)H-dependent flavin oxidoreductase YrpB (nitropropane dioxygenase family)
MRLRREDVELTGERLREQIRKVRRLTRKPFAVNIPIGVGEGLKYSKKCVEVVIEEAVPVVIPSVGGIGDARGVLAAFQASSSLFP